MHKKFFVYQNGKPEQVIIRNYKEDDFEALIEVQRQSFPPPFPEDLWWNKEQLQEHITRFPEGALCAEAGGQIVGSMTGLIVAMQDYEHQHQWDVVTDNGYIRNHNSLGDTLYVVDICVVPAYRKSGLGKWLMQSMYETVVHLGLKKLAGGGRMPGYHKYINDMTPESYLNKIVSGELSDPVISFLLKCGRIPAGVAHSYLEDEQSCNCAIIMEWNNPFK